MNIIFLLSGILFKFIVLRIFKLSAFKPIFCVESLDHFEIAQYASKTPQFSRLILEIISDIRDRFQELN